MMTTQIMGTTKHAVVLCIVVATASGSASADAPAPRSLGMREPRTARRPWAPGQVVRRVAQQVPDAAPTDAPPTDAAPADGVPADGVPADGAPPAGAPTDATPADTASPPSAPTPPPPAATSSTAKLTEAELAALSQDDGKTEVISVTDSTIEHKLLTGRAPVSIVTRADLAASGRASLGDILQSLPAQSNAGNAQVNAGGDGTVRINLRGLGAPRTLVLLNGRRVVNGGPGADSAVDINSIPLAMIERVEILKDGASATYGADAVGGVVNLITRPQFDGTDVSLLASTSQRGDGTEYDASFVTGFTTRNKRTYLVLSAGFQGHDPVFAGDRAFSTFQKSYDFASKRESRNASLTAPGGRLDVSSISIDGMPTGIQPPGCSAGTCRPDGNGGWSDFVAPRDLYNEAAENYLYTPSSRYNIFATAGNQLTDNSAVLVEFLYLQRNSDRQLSPVAFVADSPISKDSIYNQLGGDILDYRRRVTELGPRQYLDSVLTFQLVTGVTGNIPAWVGVLKDWKYELSYNFGSTTSHVTTNGQLLKPRLADALGPSMLDANGVPICVRKPGDATTKIEYVVRYVSGSVVIPCVPLNMLAPSGEIPRDQLEKLTYSDAADGSNTLGILTAVASGRIVELPNDGDISLSFGGNARREIGSQIPAVVASVGYTTDNAVQPTDGRFQILEGFSELSIVPVSGHAIARRVELDLGARVLRHDRFGSSLTYKAGGLFRTLHGVALRGTYATAFRAPALADTFGGRGERLPAAEDPCDTAPPSVGDGTKVLDPMVQAQCTAQGVPVGTKFNTAHQLALTGGNADLKPETAATTTIGLVVEPPQVPGLVLAADYWRIHIDNAIETLGVQAIFANCYDRGVQSFCDQIHRDPVTHRISPVDQFLQNVNRTTTSGIDLALWYDTKVAALGRFHTGLEAQYLLRYDLDTSLQVIHGAGFYDLGVYPRYKANLSSSWAHPSGASGGFILRYIGSYKECAGNNCNNDHNLAEASRDVDRYVKLDLFAGYEARSRLGKTTLRIGVNNVLDATPPVVYNAAAANSDAATYDFVGRMAYLRLSQLF
jgi:outer membrane receptor protein involved in Fe transport